MSDKEAPAVATHYKCHKCGKTYPRDPHPPMVHAEDGGPIIPQYPMLKRHPFLRTDVT
jgi:hypothetical protein